MKRWLLVPLLLPLAAALAVALLNLRVPARLRLLIWTSPPFPLGTWVLIAAGGGAAAAALAGLSAPGASPRQPEPWDEPRRHAQIQQRNRQGSREGKQQRHQQPALHDSF